MDRGERKPNLGSLNQTPQLLFIANQCVTVSPPLLLYLAFLLSFCHKKKEQGHVVPVLMRVLGPFVLVP